MKVFLLTLFFIGIIMTIIGFYMSQKNNVKKVEYRFVGQNLGESQKLNKETIYDTYKPMFNDSSILG